MRKQVWVWALTAEPPLERQCKNPSSGSRIPVSMLGGGGGVHTCNSSIGDMEMGCWGRLLASLPSKLNELQAKEVSLRRIRWLIP